MISDPITPGLPNCTDVQSPSVVVGGRDGQNFPLDREAEKLRQLAAQIEAFLTRQIDRLDRELEWVPRAGTGDVDRMMDEFQVVRTQWEQDRRDEQRRLQEDAERLVDAWSRLEAEQREMLKQRMQGKSIAAINSPPVTRTQPPARPEGSLTAPSPAAAMPNDPGSVANPRNQLQFQQLRREMLEHARQRRKS